MSSTRVALAYPLINKVIADDDLAQVRDLIYELLNRCNLPFTVTAFDQAFFEDCYEEASKRGYPLAESGPLPSIRSKLINGVVMATTTFGHIRDRQTQLFIALYTAVLMYLEDYLQNDIELISSFNERFILKQRQDHVILDALAEILLELPQRFERIAANLMLTSTLNYVTAIWIEHETDNLELSADAISFPAYSRWISGASEAFASFVFASELPLQAYIHALPDMMTFLNFSNDVLSFYKEEAAGESANHISILARCQQLSKIEVLHHVVEEVVASHKRLRSILATNPIASEAADKLFQGYVSYHASLSRYRLKEFLAMA